jgi:D-sedoheptulose 7-phosphate isomerase
MKKTSLKILDELFTRMPSLLCVQEQTKQASEILSNTAKDSKKIISAGNGGCASDALHIAGELGKSFLIRRKNKFGLEDSVQALSLVSETALITAILNDMGEKYIFSQQLHNIAQAGDALILLSTSGDSEDITEAAEEAKRLGVKSIALTGQDSGKLRSLCDIVINVPASQTYKAQEYFVSVYHALCAVTENELFGE